MNKGTHFLGQPLYSQVLSLPNKPTVLQYSRKHSGERYVKSFDAWTHLVVMLYAVIHRFDSLREITASLQADARKLQHLDICNISARSTLSDANKRRPQAIFADIYRDLYARYRPMLSSDSRGKHKEPQWMKRLSIVDSTTMTLFSNLIFKGVGLHPRRGKKKGGIKVHTMIHANEGVPSGIRFTSTATHDSFMLCPCSLAQGVIIAMDRAYYAKFEQMTQLGITYVTKMKTELSYEVLKDESIQTPEGLMQVRIQDVVLSKKVKAGEAIEHRARIVTYPDENKKKLISLLTNDFELDPLDEILQNAVIARIA